MSREHVSFPGGADASQGGAAARLVGRLESPEGEPVAYALFAHCFACSKDLKSSGIISRELLARGIAVLRFDFTGIGESEGDLADTTFTANVGDVVAAADFLRREHRAPALLIGHSLGGAAVLAAAPRVPEAVAVATIAAPSHTRHARGKLLESLPPGAGQDGERAAGRDGGDGSGGDDGSDGGELLELDLGGPRPVRVRRQLLDDLGKDHLRGILAHLGKALLILHSPVDRVVGIEHAERLFLEARHPKSFVSLGTADHLLSDPRDAAHAGAVLAAWAGRYVDSAAHAAHASNTAETAATALREAGSANVAHQEPEPRAPAQQEPEPAATARREPQPDAKATAEWPLGPGEVEVRGLSGNLRQEVRAGSHALVADEPLADGGTDAGPTPYGLLVAALGACTSMTLHLYAKRKNLPLEETRVRLRHSRDHAADCADCVKETASPDRVAVKAAEQAVGAQRVDRGDRADRVDRIEVELEILGPLTDAQRQRLLAIADRCPVHRTLSAPVNIVTRLR
jgi:uncharacterized OsmC-like protein/pimeloyl-ACP methyl ester carboxylesterase